MCDDHRQHRHVRWSASIKPPRFYTHRFCSSQQLIGIRGISILVLAFHETGEFASRSPSVWKHGWAEELQWLAFRKRCFSFVIFCFPLVYRGGVARKDHSTQKQEGSPLAAGHLWPPRQEADIQPAVTDVFSVEDGHIYVHIPPSVCWKLHVMFELFLFIKIDLRSFHFEVFCLKGWPLTLVPSDQCVHSSSVLHWLYAWATSDVVPPGPPAVIWWGGQRCSVLNCCTDPRGSLF